MTKIVAVLPVRQFRFPRTLTRSPQEPQADNTPMSGLRPNLSPTMDKKTP